jgi:hypothetical protein
MVCQQYEQSSGCTGCTIGGCAKQNSCATEGCIKQRCGMMVPGDQLAQFPSSKQEIAILQCNRRCKQSSCRIVNNCLKKLEEEYQIEG